MSLSLAEGMNDPEPEPRFLHMLVVDGRQVAETDRKLLGVLMRWRLIAHYQ